MSLIIRLPFPAAELFPNRKNGKHWTSTARIKTEQREAGYLCALAALEMSGPKVWEGNIPLSLVYMPKDKRKRDLDNLLAASKATLDGVASALGIDDTRFKPILIDVVHCGGEGAVIAAVGIKIVSGVEL